MGLGDQVVAWAEEFLEVELTDDQRRLIHGLYDSPGGRRALARSGV